MNFILMCSHWRQRLRSPGRMVLLMMIWLLAIARALYRSPVEPPESFWSVAYVLVLGNGIIGRDITTGTIQLILVRPIRRAEYVLSRWLALSIAAFAISLFAWIVILPFALSGRTLPIMVFPLLLEYLLAAFGTSAAIVAFSALSPGSGDLALIAIGTTIGLGLNIHSNATGQGWATFAAREVMQTILPHLTFGDITIGGELRLSPLIAWASRLTLSLFVAVWSINHRELSYASST